MSIFVGRQRELALLRELTRKRSASLVVVRGRRRIGKSRLIEEFCKSFKTYIFTGLPPTPETTEQSQLDVFAKQMGKQLQLPTMQFSDWADVFWFLADRIKEGRIILVLDEISWMGSKDPDFLGKLKTAWDTQFKNNDQLMLILCGSVSAWLERNILAATGFMGRISSTLTLDELSLSACNAFWPNQYAHIAAYEKFKLLAVTGGIPRYLEEIQPTQSAEHNIKRMCFSKEGFLFYEFEQIFSDLFLARSTIYRKIILSLIDRYLEPNEICDAIHAKQNNTITDYLNELALAGFIRRDYIWHIKSGKASKLSHYRLKDNYIRFYLKYIVPNKTRIESGTFDYKQLSLLPGWQAFMGLQFENLVLNNRNRLWELMNISQDEVIWDNPFFQRGTVQHPSCQIDYLIQTKFGCLYVCEIKFSVYEVKADVLLQMQKKIGSLKKPKGFSVRPVLIHVNGVQQEVLESGFFAEIIDFGTLL